MAVACGRYDCWGEGRVQNLFGLVQLSSGCKSIFTQKALQLCAQLCCASRNGNARRMNSSPLTLSVNKPKIQFWSIEVVTPTLSSYDPQ